MILFLDFDGVIHPVSGGAFDLTCLGYLEHALANHPQVEIVITSSWREHYPILQLKQGLGNVLSRRVIGQTPVFKESAKVNNRYREVLQYLKDTGQNNHPWVALDDTPELYPGTAPVIWCNSVTGITEREAMQLSISLRVLNYHHSSK